MKEEKIYSGPSKEEIEKALETGEKVTFGSSIERTGIIRKITPESPQDCLIDFDIEDELFKIHYIPSIQRGSIFK